MGGRYDPTERWGGIAGLVSVALILAPAVLFLGGGFPEPGDSPSRVAELLVEHRTEMLVALTFEVVSLGLVLWFFAVLRDRCERNDASAQLPARIAFAASVALSVLIWVEDSILAASVRFADRGADPELVASTREVGLLVAWPSARAATVVILIGFAVALLRSRVVHPALVWFGVLSAVLNGVFLSSAFADEGALAPASDVGEVLAVGSYYVWVFAVALALVLGARARRAGSETLAADAQNAPT